MQDKKAPILGQTHKTTPKIKMAGSFFLITGAGLCKKIPWPLQMLVLYSIFFWLRSRQRVLPELTCTNRKIAVAAISNHNRIARI